MSILSLVDFVLPSRDNDFFDKFVSCFAPVGTAIPDGIEFIQSHKEQIPTVTLRSRPIDLPHVVFHLDSADPIVVTIEITTGKEWPNTYTYSPISISEFIHRMEGHPISSIDHVGFNLPWDKEGIHPTVLSIRDTLKSECLYHMFPTGEAWDFILPATIEEIKGQRAVDYSVTRKPKIEIVSFAGCSVPIMQFDVGVQMTYQVIARTFPEGIHLDDIGSVWVYVTNPYGLDICVVLSESKRDWSDYFHESRLI